MWLLFGVGPILAGMVISVVLVNGSPSGTEFSNNIGLMLFDMGFFKTILVLALPSLGGLAISSRLYSSNGERILGGILMTFGLALVLGAVGFAGCTCAMLSKMR